MLPGLLDVLTLIGGVSAGTHVALIPQPEPAKQQRGAAARVGDVAGVALVLAVFVPGPHPAVELPNTVTVGLLTSVLA